MAAVNIASPTEDISRDSRMLITRVGTIRTRERAISMGVTSIDASIRVSLYPTKRIATPPKFLSHLKTYSGYPVPFTQVWIDDKPDFRAVDPARTMQCVQEKLCAICGRRLGEKCCFIGRPLSKTNRLFTDPPMHKPCADFDSQ